MKNFLKKLYEYIPFKQSMFVLVKKIFFPPPPPNSFTSTYISKVK